jgi:hypothetical protein
LWTKKPKFKWIVPSLQIHSNGKNSPTLSTLSESRLSILCTSKTVDNLFRHFM